MITSSNGNIFLNAGPLCRNSSVTGEFSAQRPVMRSFDVLFDLRLNKRLSKQSRCWRFETPWQSSWHHHNASSCSCELHPYGLSVGEYVNPWLVWVLFAMDVLVSVSEIGVQQADWSQQLEGWADRWLWAKITSNMKKENLVIPEYADIPKIICIPRLRNYYGVFFIQYISNNH